MTHERCETPELDSLCFYATHGQKSIGSPIFLTILPLPSHRCRVARDGGLARFHEAVQNHKLIDVGLLLLEREVLQTSPAELVLVELDQPKVLQELIRVPILFRSSDEDSLGVRS